jgi:hypothetical protein
MNSEEERRVAEEDRRVNEFGWRAGGAPFERRSHSRRKFSYHEAVAAVMDEEEQCED